MTEIQREKMMAMLDKIYLPDGSARPQDESRFFLPPASTTLSRPRRRAAEERQSRRLSKTTMPTHDMWTKSAGQILEKVARAKEALESQH